MRKKSKLKATIIMNRSRKLLLLSVLVSIASDTGFAARISAITTAGSDASATYTTEQGLTLIVDDTPEFAFASGAPSAPGHFAAFVTASVGAGEGVYNTTSYAEVSLAEGVIRASAEGLSSALASAAFFDELTFTNNTGAVALVSLDYFLDGVVSGPSALVNASFVFGGSASFVYRLFGTETSSAGGTWESYVIGPPQAGNAGAAFRGVHALPPGESVLSIGNSLILICGLGISCDFAHSAQVGMMLPTGVSFVSESGVFLTETASPIPEPSTLLLSLVGLWCVGLLRGKRKD